MNFDIYRRISGSWKWVQTSSVHISHSGWPPTLTDQTRFFRRDTRKVPGLNFVCPCRRTEAVHELSPQANFVLLFHLD